MDKSQCCNAPIDQDSTGDRICTACGLIIDNYLEQEDD